MQFGDHAKRKYKMDNHRNYSQDHSEGSSHHSLYKLGLKDATYISPPNHQKKCILRQKSLPCKIKTPSENTGQKRTKSKDSSRPSVRSPGVSFVDIGESEGFMITESMWTAAARQRIDLTKKQPRNKCGAKSRSWTSCFIFPLFVLAMILIGALLYLINKI